MPINIAKAAMMGAAGAGGESYWWIEETAAPLFSFGVDITSTGNVVCGLSFDILLFDPDGNRLWGTSVASSAPRAPKFDTNGDVWTVDGPSILKLNGSDGTILLDKTITSTGSPLTFITGPSGDMYLIGRTGIRGYVTKFNTSMVVQWSIEITFSDLSYGPMYAITGSRLIWIDTWGGGGVWMAATDLGTGLVEHWKKGVGNVGSAMGTTACPDGDVLFLHTKTSIYSVIVIKTDPSGTAPVNTWAKGLGYGVSTTIFRTAVAPNGDIFILEDTTGVLVKLDSSGNILAEVTIGTFDTFDRNTQSIVADNNAVYISMSLSASAKGVVKLPSALSPVSFGAAQFTTTTTTTVSATTINQSYIAETQTWAATSDSVVNGSKVDSASGLVTTKYT